MIITETEQNILEIKLNFDELTLDPADIITVLGYADDNSPEYLSQKINEVFKEAGPYCLIRGGYRLFANFARVDNSFLRVENVDLAIGKILARQLGQANGLAVFVCTIGAGLEEWSKQLMHAGDFIKGYVVDATASLTVDAAMDKIQDYLEQNLSQHGKKTSHRFSPGYCDWPVSQQQQLFSLLPEKFCGVTLTEASLMLPIKSISGIIGFGPNMVKIDNSCRLCHMKNCTYRRLEKNQQER